MSAELRFQAWAQRCWPDAKLWSACGADNMQQHWDFLFQRGGAGSGRSGVRIDVKAARKASRAGDSVSQTHTWLELQSADPTQVGSLFGCADVLAFEVAADDWLFVPRGRLVKWAMRHITRDTPVTRDRLFATSPTAPFALYTRRGVEVLAWVNISDVLRPLATSATLPEQAAAFDTLRAAGVYPG